MRNFTCKDTHWCMLAVCSSAEVAKRFFLHFSLTDTRCPLVERPMALNRSLLETSTRMDHTAPTPSSSVTLTAEEPRHRQMLLQTCTITQRPLGERNSEGT